MKALAVLLFTSFILADGAPRAPTPSSFRYIRAVTFSPVAPLPQLAYACAVLDADVFAHSNPLLSDLRLLAGPDAAADTPYVITLSSTLDSADPASLLNLGLRLGSSLSFDLRMPSRPYSSLDLHLDAQDYIASATLTGLQSLSASNGTYLGAFTLFDLTSQRLGHNLHLDFAESNFAYLHVDLTFTPAPGSHQFELRPAIVTGADVPASRSAQTLFTTVLATSIFDQQLRKSVATFNVPAHVPVERISFDLQPNDDTSFSRHVTISGTPDNSAPHTPVFPEQLSGEITHLHIDEAGREIRTGSLSIPAILGANGQSSAKVQVTIENGDDRPLAVRSVRLEMRQRKLCFPMKAASSAGSPPSLFYGAPTIPAPVYDLERLFDPAQPARFLLLGPEQANPRYAPDVVFPKPFTERHPVVLWIALFAVVAVLGSVALRSANKL